VAYLIDENRILRGHLRGRLRLTDEERRQLAMHGRRLGRCRLRDVATIATPDTILRWIGSSSHGNGRKGCGLAGVGDAGFTSLDHR
jgi:hypothetical protein